MGGSTHALLSTERSHTNDTPPKRRAINSACGSPAPAFHKAIPTEADEKSTSSNTDNAKLPLSSYKMKDRPRKKAMHTPGPRKHGQATPRFKKAGLQSHTGLPSHSSKTNSFLGSASSSVSQSSPPPRCKSMDENAVSLQVRSASTNIRDGQFVSVARRNDTLRQVNALFDR